LNSGFDYLPFLLSDIYLLRFDCYTYAANARKHISWAVKWIYWSRVLEAESIMLGGICILAPG